MLVNLARASDLMCRHRLDGLVATAPVSVTYLSDYFLWANPLFKEYMMTPGASSELFHNYAFVPRQGEPALFVGRAVAANAADCWVKDVHACTDDGLGALAELLRRRGLETGRIGFEMDGFPSAKLEELRLRLPSAALLDCSNLIRIIRMVKSGEEIARLRRAAEISERAASAALRLARGGVSMLDLTQEYRIQAATRGANLDHFAFGLRGRGIATEPDYVLRGDEVMYIDFGCEYRHYFSDSGLTLALTDPAPRQREKYGALLECIAAGQGAMRAGTNASTVCRAMHRVLDRHGLSGLDPHGHGLGLEVRDYPIIVRDNGRRISDHCIDVPSDLPLETGMVLNLEVSVLNDGEHSLHIEQSFLVGDAGAEPLVPHDRRTICQFR
jgi:Xaa-Pro aminopeptidase